MIYLASWRNLLEKLSVAYVRAPLSDCIRKVEAWAAVASPWMLRIPGAPKPLQLLFEGAKLEAGSLEAVGRIRNVSGAFAGGLRLDLLEISEGAPVPEGGPTRVVGPGKSRPLPAATAPVKRSRRLRFFGYGAAPGGFLRVPRSKAAPTTGGGAVGRAGAGRSAEERALARPLRADP